MIFSVVVLDDNPFVRESIIKTIDWNTLGCEVVGEAADGIEGKSIILEKKPQIIITDICMPGIDGLELMELIKPIPPNSKTIAITAYQDFEYAKKAVKLGMFDFILKPIKNEELCSVIKSVTKELTRELNAQSEHEIILEKSTRLERQYQNSLPMLRGKKISDIINGNIGSPSDINEVIQKLGIHSQKHILLIVRSRLENKLAFNSFYVTLTEFVNSYKTRLDIEIIDINIERDIAFIILFKKQNSANEALKKAKIICNGLEKKILSECSGIQYLIAVSSLYNKLLDLYEAYKELCEAMNINFFKSDCRVIYPDTLNTSRVFGKYSILNDLEEFYKVIESTDDTVVTTQLETLMDKISLYSNQNIFVAKGLLAEICITAARYYYRSTFNEMELTKSINEILLEVDALQDMEQSSKYVKEYIFSINSILKTKSKQYSQTISNVLEYINTNYTEGISLETVAEKFSVNSSYLSRILKKETGRNFTDIVTYARIEAAKKLLKTPGNRVNEVAEQVGYKDYAYFYQVFKRIEGVTPTEFKNNSKKI